MPAANRGLLDSVKTSSYHIKSVVYCRLTKKGPPNSVKLIVWRDGGNKTYEFEAEDAKKAGKTNRDWHGHCLIVATAAEIVTCVKNLKDAYSHERTGTAKQVGKRRVVL